LDRSLALRLDRLAVAAHAFHRFAHHPLCDRYSAEVFRLGRRTRICRGCTLALLGAGLGTVTGVVHGTPPLALVSLMIAVALPFIRGRTSKMATRLVPAFGVAFALSSVVHRPNALSIALAALACLSAGALAVAYRVRGPNRSPCGTCPERAGSRPCSGLRAIVLRERAVMRKTGALIRAIKEPRTKGHADYSPYELNQRRG
jgi:hypothetical protein